jgi:hypothetical protein
MRHCVQIPFAATRKKGEKTRFLLNRRATRFRGLDISFWMPWNPDGIIVFVVTTASVTPLMHSAGAVFWHERLGKWGAAGIVAAVLGMLLVTLSP